MRNTFRNIVITGALVLAPVLAAGPAMAASQDVTAQAPKQTLTNFDACGFNFYTLVQNGGMSQQSLSDLLNKLGINIKPPVVTQPDATVPDNSKPVTSKPETSKPETSKPETSKPETSKPEASKPETTNPTPSKPTTPHREWIE